MRDLFRRIQRLARHEREPHQGDVWWVADADLGILTDTTTHHPVLVVRGLARRDGPVTIAPGSSHRDAGGIELVVDPEDCVPSTTLERRTRFRLDENRRIEQGALRRRLGVLNDAKIDELKTLRERIF